MSEPLGEIDLKRWERLAPGRGDAEAWRALPLLCAEVRRLQAREDELRRKLDRLRSLIDGPRRGTLACEREIRSILGIEGDRRGGERT